MKILGKGLEKLAILQHKYRYVFLVFIIIITAFMAYGLKNVEMQSDMDKEMPQQLPIYQLNNKINDKLGAQDTILVLFSIDFESNSKSTLKDIRDPEMINYLIQLEEILSKESSIDGTTSVGGILKKMPHDTLDQVVLMEKNIPQISQFFSKDYTKTFMIIKTDVGSSEEKIVAVTNLVNDKINGITKPAGIKAVVTGTPPLRVLILNFLFSDAIFTIILASALIYLLLVITERSPVKAMVIFIPLMLGLIFTLGTMGWTDRKISIATVGLGAMILGLGVEYGVFMYTRYMEERNKGNNQLESLKVSVPAIGSSISGSGLTTIIGFLALTLSVLPMLQNLGISLAMGIFYCLTSAVFIAPVIFIIEEDLEFYLTKRNKTRLDEKIAHQRRIGK